MKGAYRARLECALRRAHTDYWDILSDPPILLDKKTGKVKTMDLTFVHQHLVEIERMLKELEEL